MTTLPTRAQVDQAGDLNFDRKPAADLLITIRATVDSFPVELSFTGQIDQLLAITKRLRALGAEPTVTTPAASVSKPKAQRVEPAYDSSGEACCPDHGTKLREGKWGLFCPTKDKASGEYCKLKFVE